MIYIILIVVILLIIRSVVKFQSMMKYYQFILNYFVELFNDNQYSEDISLKYASALMLNQKYKDAYAVYSDLVKHTDLDSNIFSEVNCNMDFCRNPVPGTNEPTNFNSSWFHNFLLVRLGKRRRIHIEQDDYLLLNSLYRQSMQ